MATPGKLTLTDFMSQARMVLLFAVVCLVFLSVWQVAQRIIASLIPESVTRTPPTPTYAFGALPAVRFPGQLSTSRPSTYALLIPGVTSDSAASWPVFGNMRVVNVYQLQPMQFSLSADQKARSIAANLNFTEAPRILDDRNYLFTYPGPPLEESLQIDTRTLFMTLDTDYMSTTNVFGITNAAGDPEVPDRVSAIAAVRNYLRTAGILPGDLSDQAATVEYVRVVGNALLPVNNALEADYVTVSLPRNPLSGLMNDAPTTYNFYGPDNVSSVYGVVGRDLNGQDVVVELEDYYHELNLAAVATYPLRPASDAWQSLLAGEAYLVNPRGIQNAVIRSVELGYYESHEDQAYLLPIYVFKGDNGVMAYVQALDVRVLTQ